MKSITASDLRTKMRESLDEVVENLDYLVVNRPKGNVVVMSEEEFNSWQETAYLLSSPKNAKRLIDGIKEFENSKPKTYTADDVDKIFS